MSGRVLRIHLHAAHGLGDIRTLAVGDAIELKSGAEKRKDWPRFVDAIGIAITRGADVRWVR